MCHSYINPVGGGGGVCDLAGCLTDRSADCFFFSFPERIWRLLASMGHGQGRVHAACGVVRCLEFGSGFGADGLGGESPVLSSRLRVVHYVVFDGCLDQCFSPRTCYGADNDRLRRVTAFESIFGAGAGAAVLRVVLAGLSVLVVVVGVGLLFGLLTRRRLPAQHGITLVVGLPGSGKSAQMMIEVLAQIRAGRVIFTNLPIEWEAFRAFCVRRGLPWWNVRALDRDQFYGFLGRVSQRHQIREAMSKSPPAVVREREDAVAPWLDDDPTPGSMVIVDEVHDWFPGLASGRPPKAAQDLVLFLMMHRHLLMRITVIVPDEIYVTKAFRDISERVVYMVDMAKVKLFGPVRGAHFGLCFFRRSEWPSRVFERGDPMRGAPDVSRVFWYVAPWNKWIFSLYRSYTHAGGLEELKKAESAARERFRADAGAVAVPVVPRAVLSRKVKWLVRLIVWPLIFFGFYRARVVFSRGGVDVRTKQAALVPRWVYADGRAVRLANGSEMLLGVGVEQLFYCGVLGESAIFAIDDGSDDWAVAAVRRDGRVRWRGRCSGFLSLSDAAGRVVQALEAGVWSFVPESSAAATPSLDGGDYESPSWTYEDDGDR